MKNIFEEAVKLKLRFQTTRGNLTSEDLYDLPLKKGEVNLYGIGNKLNKELNIDEDIFVDTKTRTNLVTQLKFEIVKSVIEHNIGILEANNKMAENKALKEKILSVIADKEDDSLKNKSLASLKKMVNEL